MIINRKYLISHHDIIIRASDIEGRKLVRHIILAYFSLYKTEYRACPINMYHDSCANGNFVVSVCVYG